VSGRREDSQRFHNKKERSHANSMPEVRAKGPGTTPQVIRGAN
jgi:hypothetical protein